MNKILSALTIFSLSAFAIDIPTQEVQMHSFSESKKINAKVIQLSNAQESIASVVSGHLEKYFVQPAQVVAKGEKIALIESIVVSRMTANFLSLKKQLRASEKNYDALKKLYDKGMTSMSELNNQSIKKSEIAAKLNALQSQLSTLGIVTKNLKKATPNYILYAHTGGKVSALLKPLHSSVNENDPVVSIAKEQAYYIKSYLPLDYALQAKIGDKIVVDFAHKKIQTHITQIMPKLDETTQRVIVLSSVDEKVENLFIDAYVEATLYFGNSIEHLAVKKSALSFFNNEWVVFIPNEEEHDEHGEHEEGHEEHAGHEEHEEHGEHEEEHEEHGEHEEHESPYTIRVVEIITEDEDFVAVNGLKAHEEYVSDKSYYVKSMILKSSLGEHGH